MWAFAIFAQCVFLLFLHAMFPLAWTLCAAEVAEALLKWEAGPAAELQPWLVSGAVWSVGPSTVAVVILGVDGR